MRVVGYLMVTSIKEYVSNLLIVEMELGILQKGRSYVSENIYQYKRTESYIMQFCCLEYLDAWFKYDPQIQQFYFLKFLNLYMQFSCQMELSNKFVKHTVSNMFNVSLLTLCLVGITLAHIPPFSSQCEISPSLMNEWWNMKKNIAILVCP